MKITFHSSNALCVFHSMAEGMAEVQADEGDRARADLLDALISATAVPGDNPPFPQMMLLPRKLGAVARDVLANCEDSAVEGDEDSLAPNDVTLEPIPGDDIEDVITALEAIRTRCALDEAAHLAILAAVERLELIER